MNDDIDVPIIKVHEGHPCLFHTNLWNANFAWLLLSNHDPWSLYGGNTLCCNPTFFEKLPHSTTVCMPPCGLCGWQAIWWQLDVRMGMPRLPLIITYVFSLVICLKCLLYKLNHAWDAIESFDSHVVHHTITTLIISTQQWEHICCVWNP